jgi:Flp pilus assembly protein TadG
MKSERGQSFIELGLSMVFLLVLLSGVMDLGRVIFTYIALRDAVQEGAAYVGAFPDDCEGAIYRIRQHTSGAVDLDVAPTVIDVTITINGTACKDITTAYLENICPGDPVVVTTEYQNFVIATPFIGAIVGGQTVNFGTQVVDSIVVDPKPGVGKVCTN